jgi:hypothetical protein
MFKNSQSPPVLRHNRIIGYVLEACNNLNVDLLEVYCTSLKCVYRFPNESESQAHFFMYGSSATYVDVFQVVFETVKSLKFDEVGRVIHDK